MAAEAVIEAAAALSAAAGERTDRGWASATRTAALMGRLARHRRAAGLGRPGRVGLVAVHAAVTRCLARAMESGRGGQVFVGAFLLELHAARHTAAGDGADALAALRRCSARGSGAPSARRTWPGRPAGPAGRRPTAPNWWRSATTWRGGRRPSATWPGGCGAAAHAVNARLPQARMTS